MAPQFVDFNADGFIDIVTGTFDGSPHVAFGSKEGFAQPKHILDAKGRRILVSQFWNYDTQEWNETDRSLGETDAKGEHGTSAIVFDWDDDGDFDLLMADYGSGHLFLQMNEGTKVEPAFTGVNLAVRAGGKVLELEEGITAPHLVDWDGDGLMDLVCGGYGDAFGDGPGGGVWLYRNVGKPGAPVFAAPHALIEPIKKKGASEPLRPDSGMYVETTDWDGDGALDLLVGGYASWQPVREKPLTEEEEKRAEELDALIEKLTEDFSKMREDALRGAGEEFDKAWTAFTESEPYKDLTERFEKARDELDTLRPRKKIEAFVWLYRQVTK